MKSIKKRIKRIIPNFIMEKRKSAKSDKKKKDLIRYFRPFMEEEKRDYLFTLIIPVYNTEDYIEECLDSVLNQTIGIENIQVVVVDDGSVDASAKLIKRYCNMYPDNVEYYYQQNAGVSTARNLGLDKARGLYVNFLDSDDMWTKNSFLEVAEYLKEFGLLDIVACKEKFFDAQTGDHPRNYIFKRNRIVDLNTEFSAFPIAAPQAFYKLSAIGNARFFEKLRHSEDARFSLEILYKVEKYGAIAKPTYMYRKRESEGSASNTLPLQRHYYTEALEYYHNYIIGFYLEKKNQVPQFVQNALAYNIGWRIKDSKVESQNDEVVAEYKERLISILNHIDDEIIADQRHINNYYKLYLISLKYGIGLNELLKTISVKEDKVYCKVSDEDHLVGTLDEPLSCYKVQFIKVDRKTSEITLEGVLPAIYHNDDNISARFSIGGHQAEAILYPRKHSTLFLPFDKSELHPMHFRVTLPFEDREIIKCEIKFCGSSFMPGIIKTGKFCGLYAKYKDSSYCIVEDKVFKLDNGEIVVSNLKNEAEIDRLERKYRKDLMKTDLGREAVEYRKYAFAQKREANDRLWLFTDRMTSAEDSGEEIFKYVNDHKPEGVETAFLIREDVPDFERLKKIGKVIAFESEENKLAVLRADKIISSAADGPILNPFGSMYNYLKDLMHFDFVFLQHGVIKDDLSDWLHRGNKDIKLFVTSAQREKDSIIDGAYGYTEKEVILTGLPRFDTLERDTGVKKERVIFIMPTWRQWLAPKFDMKAENLDEIQVSRGGVTSSDYFKFYNGLLRNERLHTLLKKYDYKINFALHPRMGAEMDSFYHDERVLLLKPESFVYGDAFKSMSLLITDYSSVAFNVALLRKPVIYAQFDYDEFYSSGKHTSTEGYFSYNDDGFGPVLYSVDAVVDEIENRIAVSCAVDDKYKARRDEFFFQPPEGVSRSQLILDCIMKHDADK